ncbi:hypothetical protein JTE90_000963 [Oedothorax gibbosus]|uniref:Uncharacterized protein n=1 Tax=Oedothorax gibbosus TaxID=931172 RepID=A0AAV6TQ83_9ARAC|nr:hypothetical protein JTE90_000963 [Oedothorax gibbosus]
MTLVSNYTIGQRFANPEIPSVVTTCTKYAEHLQASKLSDSVYTFLKYSKNSDEPLPAWTAFNCLVEKDNALPTSNIRYLPVLEANPTEFSTVNLILKKKSIDIADKMSLEEIVLVFDQAIYAKAQQIRWKEELYKKRIVIRLGEFHIVMSFLGLLGKRFKDAGLASIMVESGIVDEGSVKTKKVVLLSTEVVYVLDSSGNRLKLIFLLDNGSMSNFLTVEAATRLRLPKERAFTSVAGITGSVSSIDSD